MKSKKLATVSVILRRAVLTVLFLFSAVANFSLFTLHSSHIYGQTQKGIASYYSKRWTGRRTANGERLHHDSLTCAHRTFPFGTLLKVINPANGRVVVVRVTDRGPFGRGRIIDLSWGAAKQLGILAQGIASVVVERVSQTIVPMKDTTQISLPELELATQMEPDMKPVWQDSLQLDKTTVHRKIEQTAKKSWSQRFLDYLRGR